MKQIDHIIAHKIAEEGYGVGHHSPLLGSQFYGRPAVIVAVETDEPCRQKYGENIHDEQNLHLHPHGQETEVTEHKEQYHTHEWHVEGSEGYAESLCNGYDGFFVHLRMMAFGMPILSRYFVTVRLASGNPRLFISCLISYSCDDSFEVNSSRLLPTCCSSSLTFVV